MVHGYVFFKFNKGMNPLSQWSVIGITARITEFEPINRLAYKSRHGIRVRRLHSVKYLYRICFFL